MDLQTISNLTPVICRPDTPIRSVMERLNNFTHLLNLPHPFMLVVETYGRLVGTITDGAIRDLEELTNAECKAIARWLCVGQAAVPPARWNCEETPPPQIQFPRSQ